MKDSDINALTVENSMLIAAPFTVIFGQFIKKSENFLHVTNVRKVIPVHMLYKGIFVQFIRMYKTFLRATNVRKVLPVQMLCKGMFVDFILISVIRK